MVSEDLVSVTFVEDQASGRPEAAVGEVAVRIGSPNSDQPTSDGNGIRPSGT